MEVPSAQVSSRDRDLVSVGTCKRDTQSVQVNQKMFSSYGCRERYSACLSCMLYSCVQNHARHQTRLNMRHTVAQNYTFEDLHRQLKTGVPFLL